MDITIKEVRTKSDLRKFVHFPNELYKDNPYYVPQIESMDRDTLTPSKNHAFEVCEGKYWLAFDEKGHLAPPTKGMNSDYINEQTEVLQQKMKELMEELIKQL